MADLRHTFAFTLLLAVAPLPSWSQDYDAAARSLEILGHDLTRAQRKEITTQFSEPVAEKQDWHDESVGLLDDMAELSLTAERLSARVRLGDLHRQLTERLVPEDSLARDLLNKKDPLIHPVEAGVGMTKRDMGWAIMLEALKANMPDDPRGLEVAPGQADVIMDQVNEKFETGQPGSRHFLARVDAWGMGTVAAWNSLTLDERKIAASAVTNDAIPPKQLVEKVLGTSNILYWAAGVEVGLTDAEKAQYPDLAAYLKDGNLAGGMASFIGKRMDDSLAATTIMKGTYDLMWDLNMELLFGN